MLYHLGAIWRLYEIGLLTQLDRISSVSGGSIIAGALAMKWDSLSAHEGDIERFQRVLVDPIRNMARRTIDIGSIVRGLILPGSSAANIAKSYDRFLFDGATIQDLPDSPVFVINATNVQSGVLWRFTKRYMRDYRVGEIRNPVVPLSEAVAASSAFPPLLSPLKLTFDSNSFTPGSGQDLQRKPYTTSVLLSDGGVYDNLGLETAWKRYKTILASDAGGLMAPQACPKHDWARHSRRILDVVDNQVRSLRKRQLIASYKADSDDNIHRHGTYWGIRSDIRKFGVADSLHCPLDRTLALAETPTRLASMKSSLQEKLINWGYASCDAAVRRHVNPHIPPPSGFPYPLTGI